MPILGLLFGFLGSILTRVFAFIATKYGFQAAITAAFITVWIALIASFTAAANTCLSVAGTCGGIAVNWSILLDLIKFGLGLVPVEAITIIACLVSLYAAGWCAQVLGNLLRLKSAMGAPGLADSRYWIGGNH